MTSQGSAYSRFKRAIERGNLIEAESAIRELKQVGLRDALDYVDLLATRAPERFERAALRWHSRFEAEHPGLTLTDSLLALSSLQALVDGDRPTGLSVLRYFAKRVS